MPRLIQDDLPTVGERGPLERLLRRADAVGEDADRAIKKAIREVRAEIALLVRETNVGGSASAREDVIEAARKRLGKLRKRLERLTSGAANYAARAGFDSGMIAARATTDDALDVHYSKARADEICGIVTSSQGKNLAAVFTENMEKHVIDALRSATVSAMREQAVAGGTQKELARLLEEKWLAAAKAGETYEFVDAGGNVWDTKSYVAMNVRTNSMRVYNDSLVDTIGRSTGSDLVRVSRGGDPDCRLCFPWEGRILSITGKTAGFPTYDEAREAGLFHPNCVHTLETVNDVVDADEIDLQRKHPMPNGDDGISPEAADDNRYEIDIARYRKSGLSAEAARRAVDRDNLSDSLQGGLIYGDARRVVDSLTDEQIDALVKNGNPPAFAPSKDNGGSEAWNHGSKGGVLYLKRKGLTAAHLLAVAGVDA